MWAPGLIMALTLLQPPHASCERKAVAVVREVGLADRVEVVRGLLAILDYDVTCAGLDPRARPAIVRGSEPSRDIPGGRTIAVQARLGRADVHVGFAPLATAVRWLGPCERAGWPPDTLLFGAFAGRPAMRVAFAPGEMKGVSPR